MWNKSTVRNLALLGLGALSAAAIDWMSARSLASGAAPEDIAFVSWLFGMGTVALALIVGEVLDDRL